MPLLRTNKTRTTIVDLPDESRPSAHQDLFSPYFPNVEKSASDLSAPVVEALLESEAARGTALAQDGLRTAIEARKIGSATAEQLQKQTRQLEGIREDIHDVHAQLDGTEKVVEKLTKSKVRRVAERPFQVLEGVRRKSRGGGARLDVRKGWDRLSKGGGVVDGKRVKGHIEPDSIVDDAFVEENYSAYSSATVRANLSRQDRYLAETGRELQELKSLALGIQDEIEREAVIVDSIDAPELTSRIRTNRVKLRRELRV